MVFSSLLFIFVFLVLNLVIYFFAPKKYKNQVLLIFSLIFYAWGGPRFLILLVGTNQENCDLIFRRILDKFSSKHKSWKQNLEYYVSSVADVENDNSRLHFHRNEFHWN